MAQLEFFSDRDLDGPRRAKDWADCVLLEESWSSDCCGLLGSLHGASIHGEIYAEGN